MKRPDCRLKIVKRKERERNLVSRCQRNARLYAATCELSCDPTLMTMGRRWCYAIKTTCQRMPEFLPSTRGQSTAGWLVANDSLAAWLWEFVEHRRSDKVFFTAAIKVFSLSNKYIQILGFFRKRSIRAFLKSFNSPSFTHKKRNRKAKNWRVNPAAAASSQHSLHPQMPQCQRDNYYNNRIVSKFVVIERIDVFNCSSFYRLLSNEAGR